MTRKFRRLTLYEEIRKGQGKFVSGDETSRTGARDAGKQQLPDENCGKKDVEKPKLPFNSLHLSRSANVGRSRHFRSSMFLVGALVLAVVLISLGALKLGKNEAPIEEELFGLGDLDSGIADVERPIEDEPVNVDESVNVAREGRSVELAGDHVIVIATYTTADHLEPVQDHFGKNGVETVIEKTGSYYFLSTKEKYQSTQRRGSDGWLALEKIKKIGAVYKAPTGFESFAPNLFQDAYGKKVK